MTLKTTYLKPTFGAFFKYFTLSIISLFAVQTLIHVFTSPNPFEFKFYGWWPTWILLIMGTSIGVTLGSGRFQLVIADASDIERANNWTVEFLTKAGLTIKSKKEGEIALESTKSLDRLFNNWFGTELISVQQTADQVIIAGPFRLVDRLANSVDSKLRLGRPMES